MTDKKPATVLKQTSRGRRQGYLHCRRCRCVVPYAAMGDPDIDMPFPKHRCGRDVRDFDGWTEERP